jgi:hypothetical protein
MLNIPSTPPLHGNHIFITLHQIFPHLCKKFSDREQSRMQNIYLEVRQRTKRSPILFFQQRRKAYPTGIFKCDHHFMTLTSATYCTVRTQTLRWVQNLNLRHIYLIGFFLFLTPFFPRLASKFEKY